MNLLLCRLAPAAALSLPCLAAALPHPDPADARAPARPLHYVSAFADYKPWHEIRPGPWRQLNDGLRPAAAGAYGHDGHGGHGGHGAPADAAPAPAPAMPGHHHHHHPQGGPR